MLTGKSTTQLESVQDAAGQRLNANLRKLRREVQDLASMIARAKTGNVRLDHHEEYVKKTFSDATKLIKEIQEDEGSSDTIRHILNIWEQMKTGKEKLLEVPATQSQSSQSAQIDPAAYLMFLTLLE